jgi:hypothetical protein
VGEGPRTGDACSGCSLAREEDLDEYDCARCGSKWGPPRTSDATAEKCPHGYNFANNCTWCAPRTETPQVFDGERDERGLPKDLDAWAKWADALSAQYREEKAHAYLGGQRGVLHEVAIALGLHPANDQHVSIADIVKHVSWLEDRARQAEPVRPTDQPTTFSFCVTDEDRKNASDLFERIMFYVPGVVVSDKDRFLAEVAHVLGAIRQRRESARPEPTSTVDWKALAERRHAMVSVALRELTELAEDLDEEDNPLSMRVREMRDRVEDADCASVERQTSSDKKAEQVVSPASAVFTSTPARGSEEAGTTSPVWHNDSTYVPGCRDCQERAADSSSNERGKP